jgi:ribonuclease HI
MKLWENKTETVQQVINRANHTIQAWTQANNNTKSIQAQVQREQQLSWQPPPSTNLKCNIDAAIFTHENKVSMGTCLRDESGGFIDVFSCHDKGMYTAAEAEAWGLRKRIEWIAQLGYNKVIFEMNRKMVVNDVHKYKPNRSEYGSLIRNCKTLLSNYSDLVVGFAGRPANDSAHALAKVTLSHASHITFNFIPQCITNIIMNEMS